MQFRRTNCAGWSEPIGTLPAARICYGRASPKGYSQYPRVRPGYALRRAILAF